MSSVSEWDLPEPFCIDVVVGEGDIDGYGHANNTSYLRWCEQVVWAHSRSIGLDMPDFQRLGRAMVVRRTELDYLAPAFAGDCLQICNWVVATDRRVSARRQFQIRRPADAGTLLRAQVLYACIDLASGRPARMPPEFADRYAVDPEVRAALLSAGRKPDKPRA